MEQREKYWPNLAWRTVSPQALGLEAEEFVPLHQYAEEDERVHSMLIIRSGYIVFEEYYHGWSQNHYHNVNSVWAIGFGGQLIICFPDLDLIFAMTARPDIGKPSVHIKIMNEAFGPLLETRLARSVS